MANFKIFVGKKNSTDLKLQFAVRTLNIEIIEIIFRFYAASVEQEKFLIQSNRLLISAETIIYIIFQGWFLISGFPGFIGNWFRCKFIT